MECWSDGVLEQWVSDFYQYSNTPVSGWLLGLVDL